MLTSVWISRDMNHAEPPVIANGVVFAYGEDTDHNAKGGLMSHIIGPSLAQAARVQRQVIARIRRRTISALGCTPTIRSTSWPDFRISSAGILMILKRSAVSGLSSTFILAN